MALKRTGIDIQVFGGVFLIVGAVDLVIIVLFPSYALKLFGTAVGGPLSFLAKLHAPAVHLLIGYGFLWMRPWAWALAVAYSGFGVLSEVMNQLALGFHPLRFWFIVTTIAFLGYLLWRRSLFGDQPPHKTAANPASQEVP